MARCLVELGITTLAEDRSYLTDHEAASLDDFVQGLSAFDKETLYPRRAKHAKSTGRFKKKKGISDPEVEACAK